MVTQVTVNFWAHVTAMIAADDTILPLMVIFKGKPNGHEDRIW
jgi:hypothetical protein